MSQRKGDSSPFTIGAIALLAIAVGTWAIFTKFDPFAHPFEVKAAFKGPTVIRKGTPVRIAGIDVGKVTGVEQGPDEGTALVKMEIRNEGLPLRRDATFKVRSRLFLEGSYFIDVTPGTPQARQLHDGELVPATQTAGPVSIGDVLKVFESNTRKDVRHVVNAYGRALSGGGAAGFNRSARYWERAYGNSAAVNDALQGEHRSDLAGYLRESGRVASALSRNEPQLRDLITNLAQTADAFARQQAALTGAVAELPSTLDKGYRAFGALDDALPAVRVLARKLTPALRSSPQALDAAIPLTRELRRLISQRELGGVARSLSTASPSLASFARGGVHLQGEQRLFSSCLNNVALPTSEATIPDPVFPASGPVYEEFVKWMPGLAGAARNFDANGIWSRSLASSGNFAYPVQGRIFYNTQPLLGINPAPAAAPPLRPHVPCETQQPPDLSSQPMTPPSGLKAAPEAPGDVVPAPAVPRLMREEELQRVLAARGSP